MAWFPGAIRRSIPKHQTPMAAYNRVNLHVAVSEPVAVRYAWADNPSHANLTNDSALPASPFRTDDSR